MKEIVTTFGVEVEMVLPPSSLGALIAAGRGWSFVRDESIFYHESTPPEASPVEAVSPVLATARDLGRVTRLVERAADLGAYLTPSCGMHVHVGARDATVAQILRLVLVAALHEDTLRRRVTSDARSGWCSAMSDRFAWRARELGDAIWTGDTTEAEAMQCLARAILGASGLKQDPKAYAAARGKYHPARNVGLNLYSWLYRGTVEFRYFDSTLRPSTARQNILIAQRMYRYGMQEWDAPMPTQAQIFGGLS